VAGATLKAGESATYPLGKDRKAYLVPATGKVEIEGQTIEARDGAAIAGLDEVRVTALVDSEIVLVDVA
jgi:redox-sensitive bicupin YhaK (pirin superfamily)